MPSWLRILPTVKHRKQLYRLLIYCLAHIWLSCVIYCLSFIPQLSSALRCCYSLLISMLRRSMLLHFWCVSRNFRTFLAFGKVDCVGPRSMCVRAHRTTSSKGMFTPQPNCSPAVYNALLARLLAILGIVAPVLNQLYVQFTAIW